MIQRLLACATLAAGLSLAGPIQYTLNVQSARILETNIPSFSLTVTLAGLMANSGVTVLTGEPSLVTSGIPNFSGASSSNNNYLTADFFGGGGNLRGIFLYLPVPPGTYDHPGVFAGTWQLTNVFNGSQSNIVAGTLTVTDLSGVPEPASVGLAAAAMVAWAISRRWQGAR